MGANRELKKAVEGYWSEKVGSDQLLSEGKRLRREHWKIQKDAGVDIIASNDFSFYDQVLDHIQMFNAVPKRYTQHNLSALDVLFAMGRGVQKPATASQGAVDVPSLEMVKWFDSNYHYVRPTFSRDVQFSLNTTKPVDEYLEAKESGVETRPVLLGPVSFLSLGKADKDSQGLEPISLLEKLLPVYEELLKKLASAGASWVQMDEPVLVLDISDKVKSVYKAAYERLSKVGPKIMFTTYFGDILPNLDVIKGLAVDGVHVDLVRAGGQLDSVVAALSSNQIFSAGVVDGRNIWKTDFQKAINAIDAAVKKLSSSRVIVATSSSLLHTPHTLASEKKLSAEVLNWFSFATEKCKEVAIIAKAVNDGAHSVKAELKSNADAIEARQSSKLTNDATVRKRQADITDQQARRLSAFPQRLAAQKKNLHLPDFPTTTIGSFPQTKDIRVARQKFTKGEINQEEYDEFIKKEIQQVVKFQEDVGLDVFVHGEPERNDMVQYFGEQLKGFVFTTHAWVQSYGSRCVRPPIIVGDISRPKAMSVKESKYAQSLTQKPMKGMLTGPVTCLRWSFPRDDVHQSVQAEQLALALRDEVVDLEAAGIYVIQVDEPALREGLPLRSGKERSDYLDWAVRSFRLATSGVQDSTQIHSHFCYSDFNDIFQAIKNLDADVMSIENSKSDAKLLRVFETEKYANQIGPGVYDIHSPRVPSTEEIKTRVEEMLQFIPRDQLWIDPDCGLKTRQWKETKASLKNMVTAAKALRAASA